MSLAAGTRLGPYEIGPPIGKGGMGKVYRARDTKLDREVAIKVLPEEFAKDKERLARFEREAKLLASLNHPNIASIYGLEESDGVKALVLELVDGPTLAERIANGPIPVDEAIAIAKQIAEALEAGHQTGIIHRDLKPANIKVKEDGTVKVLDYGLAKALEGDTPGGADAELSQSPTLTRHGTQIGVILGTAAYMSPEQAKGKKVDKRTDIFAFGVVLYEMLTGKKAFAGADVSDVLAAIINLEPDWTALPSAARGDVEKLVRWCLTKDVAHRLRDIGDTRPLLSGKAPSDPVESRRMTPWRWSVAGFVLGAVIAGWIARTPPENASTRIVRILTEEVSYSRFAKSLDVSPDGRRLVYLTEQEGNTHVTLRALDQAEPTILLGTQGARAAFFSPDGQQVVFAQSGNLMTASLQGGTPTKLYDFRRDLLTTGQFGVFLNSDGTIVYAGAGELWRISTTGSGPTRVTELDVSQGERSHRFPHVLPAGRHVLFTLGYHTSDSWDDADIALAPLDGSQKPRILIEGGTSPIYVSTGHILYARDGNLLAVPFDAQRLDVTGNSRVVVEGIQTSPLNGGARYAVSNDGTLAFVRGRGQSSARQLVWVDRQGRATPLPLDPAPILRIDLSPDGELIGLDIESARDDLWVYEIRREVLTRLTHEGTNVMVDWHPDGERLLYRGLNIAGEQHLSEINADGSGAAALWVFSGVRLGSWSPDGTSIVFGAIRPTTGLDILVLSLGEGDPKPFVETAFEEQQPRFSPEGDWVAYASNETGRMEVFIEPFSGPGRKWQISTDGGREPLWSPDGTELFYRNVKGDHVMVAEIRRKPKLEPEKARVLFEGSFSLGASAGPTYSLHPDGERFLMMKDVVPDPAPIEITLNWFEELKRLVPTDN